MSELKIYKASAGSGKTYQLTGEYINLLFENPVNYKHTLSVTFTNKASTEMKGRIIEQLYNISKGIDTGYSKQLKDLNRLNDDELKNRAKNCLNLILHDFSKFAIETIDSFFQKIILSFIREIGLQVGYSIELDSDNVLHEITNRLIYEVDNDDQLKRWLIDMAEGKIEDGKSWNFKDEIIQLGNELFKERFKLSKNEILKKVTDKSFFKSYISSLFKNNKIITGKLEALGNKAIHHIKQFNLDTDDFSRKSTGVAGFFGKLAKGEIPDNMNSYVRACLDNKDGWYSSSSNKKAEIIHCVESGLSDILIQTAHIYEKEMPAYHTTKTISSILPVLGIITDIYKFIKEYTLENNSFLISDAADFLYQITGNNDSPFIYEKTGNHYHYFMIDEFQDTSRLQWHNFKPLILNSLAENHNSLVVGDVKQSIYRWRNSDWKILAEEINQQFHPFNIVEEHLDQNWRSSPVIVQFNNELFQNISVQLQQHFISKNDISKDMQYANRIKNVYNHCRQILPKKEYNKEGYVNLQFLKKESFREEAKLKTIKNLEKLKQEGMSLKDIAILVRNKNDGKEIADYLINYNTNPENQFKFDFISNDSLFIANNLAIRLIIYTLKYILNQDNNLNLFSLIIEYYEYQNPKSSDYLNEILSGNFILDDLLYLLPDNFTGHVNNMQNLSLYSLIEYITRLYKLNEQEGFHPYLQAFKDVIYDFSQNKTAHLSSFIEWWDTNGSTKTISINENQDAIKIITIHKSKGLQYKAVLIPFCNWKIETDSKHNNIIWCTPEKHPFNQLPIIPVRYSSKLIHTIFQNEYLEEQLNGFIDSLNLLYVAFTRTEEVLMICAEVNDYKKEQLNSIGDLIFNSTLNLNKNSDSNDVTKMNFVLGKLHSETSKSESTRKDIFKYDSVPLFERFRFTHNANDYFNLKKTSENKIEYGTLMHNILQNITYYEDINESILKFINEGKINKTEAESIKSKLNTFLLKNEVKNWYTKSYKIKTEPELILDNGKTIRPDRVMSNNEEIIVVDYKFGEHEKNKHINQVQHYINQISNIETNKKITGYIWYVDLDLLKKVMNE